MTAPERLELPGYNPAEHLAAEEHLFNSLRAEPRPICLFYVNDPCVVLGRANREEDWLNLENIEADGLPLLRRFSGGGTVYHDRDNLNFSFILPLELLRSLLPPPEPGKPVTHQYIDWFRGLIIQALSQGGSGYSATGISDISLNGRKISGNAQRIASNLILHHGTVMRSCPLGAIERYLKTPPNRPGIAHRGFVTGLTEEGREHSQAKLMSWLSKAFNARLASEG